jgi:hypothetical protein
MKKIPNAWTRTPEQTNGHELRPGDVLPAAIYSALGLAISNWGHLETGLGMMFGFIISADSRTINTPGPALVMTARAFGSVRTSEGRLSMLSAVAETFFVRHSQPDLQAQFDSQYRSWKGYSERRNDLAHGVVRPYGPAIGMDDKLRGQFYLVPSIIDAAKWPGISDHPAYCYTSNDVNGFAQVFKEMTDKISELVVDFSKFVNKD